MKVAITYENGEVFSHFGGTPQFTIYDIEENEIVSTVGFEPTLGFRYPVSPGHAFP